MKYKPIEIPDQLEVADFVRSQHDRSKMWVRMGRVEIKEHIIRDARHLKEMAEWLMMVYTQVVSGSDKDSQDHG